MQRWARRGASLRAAVLTAGAIACSAAVSRRPAAAPAPRAARDANSAPARLVRVALAQRQPEVRLSSDGAWRILAADGQTDVALTRAGE